MQSRNHVPSRARRAERLRRGELCPPRMAPATQLYLKAVLLSLLLTISLGCGPVRLVSSYDEQIDSGTSELHTEITEFVERMAALAGKPEGTYASNAGFYATVIARASTLRLRASAQPTNELSVKLFDELLTSIDKLKQLHQTGAAGGLSPALGKPALQGIDTICGAILKFEIAKRRGDSE